MTTIVNPEKQLETVQNNWSELKDYQRELIVQLSDIIKDIGPVATEILLIQARRLVRGFKTYNSDFNFDDKDWIMEALEESLDLNNYVCRRLMEIIQKEREVK